MKTVEEAKKFLEEVKKHSATNTRSGTAKLMNLSLSKFNSTLLNALLIADVRPPKFSTVSKKTDDGNIITIMASGKSGASKRFRLNQEIYDALGWKIGDKIQVKVSKGSRLILEKLNNPE